MTHLKLSFLGSFQASLDAGAALRFRSDKSRALLAYLSVEAGRPHERATLASLFWPDMPDEDALRNLSQTLSRLRDAIQDQKAEPAYLMSSRRDLQWNRASAYDLDTAKFERWAGGDNAQQFTQAVTLYQGEFLRGFGLPDCADFETWLLLKREQYQQLALEAMQKLAMQHLARADYAQAQHYARLQLSLETWRETAHRQLMRALALNGHRSEALAQYEACRRILAEELGVEPEAETFELYEQVRSGSLGQASASAPRRTVEWSEVPDLGKFYGRTDELSQLEHWVMRDHCRLLAVIGMGGMGKTALAARLTQRLTDSFDVVIWRSVLNAPPLSDVLRAWLHSLSDQHVAALPTRLDEQLDALMHHMQQRRCLLVLDNLESIFEAGSAAIAYRPECADYGQLLQRVGQGRHQSCLVITSRERPAELSRLEGESAPAPVRSLRLRGLAAGAARALLSERGLTGLDAQTSELVSHYSGNPLALKLVAETIRDLFANDINAFLRDETPIFDDIRAVLDQQFERLSPLEREILIWLAIEREPVSVQTIQADLTHNLSRWEVLEAVRALQRRSLLDISGDGFAPHNVVIEYVTGRLIEQVCREIEQERLDALASYALLKANAREYVRESQARLILHPIAQWLMTHLGSERVRAVFGRILDRMRAAPPSAPGYAAGNLLNLLAHMKLDARGYDFSGLDVRQAYLRGALLRGVNFTGANLVGAAFSDKFGGVNALAFSPDGQLLAIAPSEGVIWLRRVADGQPVFALSGHTSIVWALAFSPDGRYLASASDDATVRLWDVQSAKAVHVWRAHSSFVHAVAFSPDGLVVASAGVDQVIRLWDVHSGESRGAIWCHAGDVHGLSFSPDGTRIASASVDKTVQVWDASSGASLRVLLGHADEVDAVAFSPDGDVLASGSNDHTIRLWDARTGDALRVLQNHSSSVGTVAFSPDGGLLASGGADHTIHLWDAHTGEALHVLQGHSSWVGAVAFSPDGRLLASGSEDQTVRLWDARTCRTIYVLSGYLQWVDAVAFSHDGRWLASGGHDRTVRLWDTRTKAVARELYGHTSWVSGVTFSSDDTLLASTSEDHTVRLWDLEHGSERHVLTGHESIVEGVAFSPDGGRLVSGSGDATVRLWNVATGQLISVLRGHTRGLEAVAFSPDGQLLASAGWDHLIILWEAHTGRVKHTLRGHDDHVATVAFSPDGSRLASAGTDRTIRLWNVASGQAECIWQGHTHWIRWVMFSQDGAQVISASGDGTVRVWNVATGQNTRVLHGHTNAVVSAALSPDGHTLASGSRDETIRLWDMESGACTSVLQPEGPYAGMDVSGVTGLTEAQKNALKSLGAVEHVQRGQE